MARFGLGITMSQGWFIPMLPFEKGRGKPATGARCIWQLMRLPPQARRCLPPLRGEVFAAEYRAGHLDYGGVIILRHETPEGDPFYTLYGHLDPAFLDQLKIGDVVEKGEEFCCLGAPSMNGGWAPHVHFQLALTTDGMEADWPGVGDPDEMYLWRAICPNPAALLNLPDSKVRYYPTDKQDVLADRQAHFGGQS